jgi:hypothetical protein
MAKVYHTKRVCDSEAKFPADYNLVAEVDSTDVEEIFVLTNNITHSWTKNAKVKAVKEKCRSTSMEDVVEINGKYFRCGFVGWKEFQPSK